MTIGKKIKKLKYVAPGAIGTLISSLYSQDLTGGRIGASTTSYEWPMSWLEKVVIVYPGDPTKYSFSPEGLLIDFLFWSIIGVPILYAYCKSRK